MKAIILIHKIYFEVSLNEIPLNCVSFKEAFTLSNSRFFKTMKRPPSDEHFRTHINQIAPGESQV